LVKKRAREKERHHNNTPITDIGMEGERRRGGKTRTYFETRVSGPAHHLNEESKKKKKKQTRRVGERGGGVRRGEETRAGEDWQRESRKQRVRHNLRKVSHL